MKPQIKETSEEKLIRESKARFLTFDQTQMIRAFGLNHDDNCLYIDFLGREYAINRQTAELTHSGIPANSNEMAGIFEFLTKSITTPVRTGQWASIAQLCTNTTSTELTKYARKLRPFDEHPEKLALACSRLGGEASDVGDISSVILVFRDVPVWFQYWEKDDEFPASVQFLWDTSVISHFRWSILWNIMDCITDRLLEAAD